MDGTSGAIAGVVIPAHNEAAVLRRTLEALLEGVAPGELEIVVVCNGCTDDTAAVARAFPQVRTVEVAEPGKTNAVAVGNRVVTAYPRVHLDADCVITGDDVVRLARGVGHGVLAAAPTRRLDLSGAAWLVRAYYEVWGRLPQVRGGLFGRGVFALTEEGQRRVDALPATMSDDLAASEAFASYERRIVADAVVTVRGPRTYADLLRRRVRIVTGNHQADRLGTRHAGSTTSLSLLAGMLARQPWLAPQIAVFVATTVLARSRSRRVIARGDYSSWQRDESSRAA